MQIDGANDYADYRRAVNEAWQLIAQSLHEMQRVLDIAGLPDNEFVSQCELRIVPSWQPLHKIKIDIPAEIDLTAKAQLQPVDLV